MESKTKLFGYVLTLNVIIFIVLYYTSELFDALTCIFPPERRISLSWGIGAFISYLLLVIIAFREIKTGDGISIETLAPFFVYVVLTSIILLLLRSLEIDLLT